MPFFGTDGDNLDGIVPNTPTDSFSDYALSGQYANFVGGQVSAAGTPTAVSFYARDAQGGTNATDIEIGVYKKTGGTLNAPSGATLLGSVVVTADIPDTNGWREFAISGASAWAADDFIYLAVCVRSGSGTHFAFRPTICDPGAANYRDDWTMINGTFERVAYWGGGSLSALPETMPAPDGWSPSSPFNAYITYTEGGGLVKKLKVLTHPSAASAASVAGVVFAQPTGANITGAEIGEFTGATFLDSGSNESGQAVLKVPVADFGGGSLTTSDTPVVLVRNTTNTTGIIPATIIEE